MKLLGFERRWCEGVLGGFAPPMPEGEATPGLLTPRPGEVDWAGVFDRYVHAGSALSHVGIRLMLWVAALSPFWMSFRFATLSSVSAEDRVRYVERLVHHKFKGFSELMLLIKLAASLALLAPASVRARSNYDRRPKKQPPRAKSLVALPIVAAVVEERESPLPTPAQPPTQPDSQQEVV
jgi:hypothetical protein